MTQILTTKVFFPKVEEPILIKAVLLDFPSSSPIVDSIWSRTK